MVKNLVCANSSKTINIWKTNFFPPGHYYSPNVDHEWIEKYSQKIFDKNVIELPGINLNEIPQLKLLQSFPQYYSQLELPEIKEDGYNYFYQNQFFSYSDAISLSCVMLHAKPKKIIEIGSGYSSALMLDINNKYFENKIELTFVEPYPEDRFSQLIEANSNYKLIKKFVQELPYDFFQTLESNDILFIDSSHVSKTGSDVNYLFFEILPKLKPGVIIHIHDVFYPFEYPKEWVLQDRAWNEAYLVRAFLQFNSSFEVMYFSSFLEYKYKEFFNNVMPKCLEKHEKWKNQNGHEYLLDTGGQSLYIKKIL